MRKTNRANGLFVAGNGKNRHALLLMCLSLSISIASAQKYERPTMGWSSWNTYRVNISDSLITKQADAMVRQGLKKAGYRYVNIDDGYFGGRDANGNLLIHGRRFPYGLQPVVEHIHRLGLKAGIYSDAGRNTCGSFWDHDEKGVGVGLYGHDNQDSKFFFNDLKFDFIKIDFCGGDASQNSEHLDLDERERYTQIHQAIQQTGRRDVRINVCRWNFPGTWVHSVGSSWRIDADISANWQAVKRIIRKNRYLSAYATGGHYNDMDMLEIGRGMTDAEERTHFGMWCMQSSPLLIGCDLTRIPPLSLALLKNKELIAINQDGLALQAYVVKQENGVVLYVKDLKKLNGTTRTAAICNLTDKAREFTFKLSDIDLLGKTKVRDVFAHVNLDDINNGSMTVCVPPHDTRIFVLKGDRRMERMVYEAETAWLERFQNIGINHAMGYAEYADDEECSGGAKVCWLGNHEDNYMEWRNVFSRKGGKYVLTLSYLTLDDRSAFCRVNGGQDVEIKTPYSVEENARNYPPRVKTVSINISLKKGINTIRIGNPKAWCPDIDKITLEKVGE